MELNNETGFSCTYGQEMLAYLYNELSPHARERFEIHLEGCSECIDEFAELAVSRYSVFEWKSVEFVPMATPKFVIPTQSKPAAAPWFDGIRAAFAWNGWAMVGGAAAVALFVVIGISLWSVQPDAAIADNDTVPSIETAPIPTRGVESPAKTDDPKLSDTAVIPTTDEFRSESVTPRRTVSAPKRSSVVKASAERKTASTAPKSRRVPANERLAAAPTLGQYVEDRDESLRLSDIFDDLDTRDME